MIKRLPILLLPIFFLALSAAAQTVSVELLWEGETSLPSFYGGHSQVTPGGTARVVALPTVTGGTAINRVAVNDFYFEWSKDGKRIGDANGVGKNRLYVRVDPTAGNVIAVTLSEPASGVALATGRLALPLTEPLIRFYEENPLGGPEFTRALGEKQALAGPDLTLRAEPFFFDEAALVGLNYRWTINGQTAVTDPSDPRLITFVMPEGEVGAGPDATVGAGEAVVNLAVSHPLKIWQIAKRALTLSFNQPTGAFSP